MRSVEIAFNHKYSDSELSKEMPQSNYFSAKQESSSKIFNNETNTTTRSVTMPDQIDGSLSDEDSPPSEGCDVKLGGPSDFSKVIVKEFDEM